MMRPYLWRKCSSLPRSLPNTAVQRIFDKRPSLSRPMSCSLSALSPRIVKNIPQHSKCVKDRRPVFPITRHVA
eukprot:5119750-Amphidinium_carterae.1